MSWLVYALGFVLLTTILALLMRKISLKTKDQRAFAFLFNACSLLVTLIAILVVGLGSVSINVRILLLVIAAGIGHGLFHRYQFLARRHIEASTIEVIMSPSAIAGYVLAVFWLGETVSLLRVVGFAIILTAGILASYTKHTKLTINFYAILAFGIGASASIAGTIDREVSQVFTSALTYAALLWLIKSIVVYVPTISFDSIRSEFSMFRWYLLIMAILNAAVLYCALSALQLAPATRVAPVLSSNVAFISVAAIVVLHERSHARRKVLAALLACIGLYLVSF